MDYFPEIVQVVPHSDYTVTVYFHDGKIVRYDMAPNLDKEVFAVLKDQQVFMNACTILNDTLAWDLSGDRNPETCIDIAPDMLYSLPEAEDCVA